MNASIKEAANEDPGNGPREGHLASLATTDGSWDGASEWAAKGSFPHLSCVDRGPFQNHWLTCWQVRIT